MAYKFTDPALIYDFNSILAIAEMFEAALVVSGRYKYVKTENNHKV
jgi:hypothetical protein